MRTLGDLTLAPEHRRGHGVLVSTPLLRAADGRGEGKQQMVPGWAYAMVAAVATVQIREVVEAGPASSPSGGSGRATGCSRRSFGRRGATAPFAGKGTA